MILQQDCVPILDRSAAIPESLASVIDKALIRKPEDRFASALHFRKALLASR